MDELKNRELPEFFKPLLWSYDFSKIDPKKDKKVIIINSINFGDMKHWKWLIEVYGKDNIRNLLEEIPVSEIRPHVRRLASLIFSVGQFNYAPRGVK